MTSTKSKEKSEGIKYKLVWDNDVEEEIVNVLKTIKEPLYGDQFFMKLKSILYNSNEHIKEGKIPKYKKNDKELFKNIVKKRNKKEKNIKFIPSDRKGNKLKKDSAIKLFYDELK